MSKILHVKAARYICWRLEFFDRGRHFPESPKMSSSLVRKEQEEQGRLDHWVKIKVDRAID